MQLRCAGTHCVTGLPGSLALAALPCFYRLFLSSCFSLTLSVPPFLYFFLSRSFSSIFLFQVHSNLLFLLLLSFSCLCTHVIGRPADWVLCVLRRSGTFAADSHTLPYALRTEPSLPRAEPVPWLRVVTIIIIMIIIIIIIVTTRNQGTGSARGREGSVRKAYGSVCESAAKVPERRKA